MNNKQAKMRMSGKKSKSKSNHGKGKDVEKPVFACHYCQKQFGSHSHLKQHVPVHTGQKDFHCNLCDYSCSQKEHLTVHIRRHVKEKPFIYPEPNCESCFTQSCNLKRHQLIHKKNPKDKRFSCSACSFKTHYKAYLTQHIKFIHSNSRPFKCPHQNCDYSAKQKGHLNVHLKTHSDDKNQVCPHPDCGYKTKWSSALKLHVETHSTGEKRFKCHFCDYSSHEHGDLVRHIRCHTGETPFACQLCSYKSKNKSDLNRHMKIHAD